MASRLKVSSLSILRNKVIACKRCRRLINYCRHVAVEKRRMYRDWDYWGKPVPGFGDSKAELLILGLAPGAHGSNRTGRMFTGDSSGDFLYRALYETGFANQPDSRSRNDGLRLMNCYITASLRCAPPGNKPLPRELKNCRPYLEEEFKLLSSVKAVLALGRIAFDTYLRIVAPEAELPPRSQLKFGHGVSYAMPGGWPRLFASYHPSRQNTQTGKLTPQMLRAVFEEIRRLLAASTRA
jgi:uracil-DNA glycosylase